MDQLYPVTVIEEDGTFIAQVDDVPEAITYGDTLEEALEEAVDALEVALSSYKGDGRVKPAPSEPKAGQYVIRHRI
ncbi:MAG: type II toxin-antitoxin system HicB family antitoxin [Deltaproteobacteria bacterium]|nr:type II toxin-antitoxin system HicB family antitoxin [Deltaproteobacteria bacterium]